MTVEAHYGELRTRVLHTILVRRITLGVFALVALVVKLTGRISYLNPLFYAPLVWFLLTFPFALIVKRQRHERTLNWIHAGFFILEIALITVLVHLMGGSEWIGNIFYLFTVIYANFFLPRLQGYLITGLVIVLYAALVLLEYAGVLPHRSLFVVFDEPYRSLSYTLTTLLAGVVGIYLTLAYTVRTFTEIYARKNRALSEREAELAHLSRRLLSAQEEERSRIARGLHDELGQSLAAVKLNLAALGGELSDEEKTEIIAILDRAIGETRTLAYSLHPPLLDDLGLVPSLRRLAALVEAAGDLKVSVDVVEGERLSREIESLLFHVAQETLSNVQEHAQATRIVVRLKRRGARLIFAVEDDGVGFRPKGRQGLGLRGIRERVEMSGGRMMVDTSPGKGTIVTVEVPLADPCSDCG
jgi:signal transduction histidine kinase